MVMDYMLLCLASQCFFSVKFLSNLKLCNGRISVISKNTDVFWLCNICIIIQKSFEWIRQEFCKNGAETL
jgi:hypothetical protein